MILESVLMSILVHAWRN